MRAALLAALLLAPALLAQAAPEPVAERRFLQAPLGERWHAFDTFVRAYTDLDGDGRPEIVVQSDDGRLLAFNHRGGRVAEGRLDRPDGAPVRDLNGIVAGDLDADGKVDLVAATALGTVARLDARLRPVWTRELDPMDAPPVLADADGDGRVEIYVQADGVPGRHALDADGEPLWTWRDGDGNAAARISDLDGDGRLEAVFASDGGRVTALDAATGEPRWEARVPAHPGSIPVAPALLPTPHGPLLVVAGRGVGGGERWIEESHTVVAAYRADGSEAWTFTADWLNPLVGAEPAVADLDGDGWPEVVFVDWNTPGHKPGNWERLPTANAFALNAGGQLLWAHAFNASWSNRSPLVLDVTGDAEPEVILVGEVEDRSALLLLGRDGVPRPRILLRTGWEANRGPDAVDLDADGRLELVVPMARPARGCPWPACRDGALAILATQGDAAQLSGAAWPRAGAGDAVLAGTVTSAGQALPQATLRIPGREVETDARGAFALLLPAGRHVLAVEAAGHLPRALEVVMRGGSREEVAIELAPAVAAATPLAPWVVLAALAVAAFRPCAAPRAWRG